MNDEINRTAAVNATAPSAENTEVSSADNAAASSAAPAVHGRKKSSLAAGFIIIIFALIGIVCCVVFAVGKITDISEKKKQATYNEYASLLISAAAVDIAPFDDITGAEMSELVEMSVWSVISDAENPNEFEYKSGSLVIPAAKVEAAFTHYFGTQRVIEHTTVQGYGYEFTYNSTENAYYIPITSLTPIYTPKVTDIEKKGNSVTATVGLINSDRWLQDSETGDLSSPEPDKYVKVTFREENGAQYISAVRALSAPETATTAAASSTPTAVQPTESNTAENESNTGESSTTDESGTAAESASTQKAD